MDLNDSRKPRATSATRSRRKPVSENASDGSLGLQGIDLQGEDWDDTGSHFFTHFR